MAQAIRTLETLERAGGALCLDTSKNQSRRWCSMSTCGVREEMRCYHKRQRLK